VIDFYGDLVQNLKAWQARAPKLPEPPEHVPEAPQAEPPPFAAVESRDVGDATTPTEEPFERTAEQPGLEAWEQLDDT
jgi:hypothetical protein